MAAIVLCFDVHQAPCLRRCNAFDDLRDPPSDLGEPTGLTYLDAERNRQRTRRLADRCYLPMIEHLQRLIQRHQGGLRLALALSGPVIARLQETCPEVIQRLRLLAQTGCCEFLSQTSHHSLSFFHDRAEFAQQVAIHRDQIEQITGQVPRVFFPAELIYVNEMAAALAGLGHLAGCLIDPPRGLDLEHPPHSPSREDLSPRAPPTSVAPPGFTLLLRSGPLSRELTRCLTVPPAPAERSSACAVTRLADRIHQMDAAGDFPGTQPLLNLMVPMARLDTHNPSGSIDPLGVMEQWVDAVLDHGDEFMTPGEAIERFDTPRRLDASPAQDDLSGWIDNAMQSDAIDKLYRIEAAVKRDDNDPALLADWRSLTTSDHFRLMSTGTADDDEALYPAADEDDSPYDHYINFMNILDRLAQRVGLGEIREA